MAGSRIATYWIPLALSVAFLILGLMLPSYVANLPSWVQQAAIALSVVLIVAALALAYAQKSKDAAQGGRGGSARVSGEDSNAIGGAGGDAGRGAGGDGGNALAKGRRSLARGGSGGKGG